MNKKITALLAFFALTLVVFNSCNSNDDSFDLSVTQEWKDYQNNTLNDIKANAEYISYTSHSGNGSVYAKASTDITDGKSLKVTQAGYPNFNDSVVCRYTGWYYQLDGTKYTFDTTEGPANSQQGRLFGVNQVIDGWITILQYMKVGDEREVCVPYKLGYGTQGSYNASTGVVTIPGYTTLFFTIKLLKIIPLNPNEFPGVTLE